MVCVHRVYIQAGYSGHDHLAPEPEVSRQRFACGRDALAYYYRRYPGWAVGIEYRRAKQGSRTEVETVRLAPRTDGRVQDGMYIMRVL